MATDARPPTSPPEERRNALAGAVRVVSLLTLLSRVGGLVRDLVTVRVFGDSVVASSFNAAFAVPNLFRRLFGEGALSAAFVPEYAQLDKHDHEHASRFASLTVALLTLATSALLIVIELALLAIVVLAPPSEDRALLVHLSMLMMPFMPMVCLTAILGGVLHVHGRFAPTAAAPVLLNLLVIAAAIPSFFTEQPDQVVAAYRIGVAVLVAGSLQVAWALWALRGRVRWTRTFKGVGDATRRMLKRFVPVLIGLGTLQLNALLDTLIATWPILVGPTIAGIAYPLDDSSNAVLGYTQRLYQFPLGVFGIAVATAVFPVLARFSDERGPFVRSLRNGLRLSFFIALPATVGLMLVRDDLVRVVFTGDDRGFSEEGAARAAAVLLGYAPAVWAYSLNHVLTRGFYALGDTRTPMRIAVVMVAFNLTLNLLLIWPLREAGLAWSTAITATIQFVVLGTLLRRRLGTGLVDRDGVRSGLGTLVGTLLMAAGVLLVGRALGVRESWTESLVALALTVGTGGAVFAVVSLALRSHELRWLLHPRSEPIAGDEPENDVPSPDPS